MEVIAVDPKYIQRMNQALPRYTSYPTAPQFVPMQPSKYVDILKDWDGKKKPLSLYIHIPFCKTMCLFCACSVTLNRKPIRQVHYLELLHKEISLIASYFRETHTVTQLHFGGGTPTSLSEEQFDALMDHIHRHFTIDPHGEISIEVDPRTVILDKGKKMAHLRAIGFNRISFGVQDTHPKVQEAVKRHQSYEMSLWTFNEAKKLGFSGINLDLIYGLPFQTIETFADTASKIVDMGPDRIALFSYAKVPWLKPHQKAIKDETLPSTEEKFGIYVEARKQFMQKGYLAIGMDHFAKKEDSIAQAYREKKLHRNFQGYSLRLAKDLIGLGISSIGFINHCYIQNVKTIKEYEEHLEKNLLPIFRGKTLSEEDRIRAWVIFQLMCNFELDKTAFYDKFHLIFDDYFFQECKKLAPYIEEGLVTNSSKKILPTPIGRLFIRNISSVFDAYLQKNDKPQYSRSI